MFTDCQNILSTPVSPEHVVVRSKDTVKTFGQLLHDVSRVKTQIIDQMKKGKSHHIALLSDSTYTLSVGFLATLSAGATVILPPHDRPELLKSLADKGYWLLPLHDMLHAPDTSSPVTAADFTTLPDAAKIVFYTSGSSGTPQEIIRTLGGLNHECKQIHAQWGDSSRNAVTLSTVSHQHLYGLTFTVLWPLCAGRATYDHRFEYWEELIVALTKSEKAVIISSPAHLSRQHLTPDDIQMQACRIVSAGAPLQHTAVENTARIWGFAPSEILGSTETGVIGFKTHNKTGQPWTVFPNNTWRANTNGCLELQSANMGSHNWYTTQDRISAINETQFHLLGRADRIVKVHGKRVSLPEIESWLSDHNLITDAAVLQLSDHTNPLAAVVVLTKAGELLRRKHGNFRFNRILRADMRQAHDNSAIPRSWRFVTTIPTNSQGKRLPTTLEALFSPQHTTE